MKRIILPLLFFTSLISAESTSKAGVLLKPGYYYTSGEFITNSPALPVDSGSLKVQCIKTDKGTGFPKFRINKNKDEKHNVSPTKTVFGFCDGKDVYITTAFRQYRKVTVGSQFSYYKTTGTMSENSNMMPTLGNPMRAPLPVPGGTIKYVTVLHVISMKNGSTAILQNGVFYKTDAKELLGPYTEINPSLVEKASQNVDAMVGILDQINKLAPTDISKKQ